MPQFTADNAADMARKSWVARRAKEQAQPEPAQVSLQAEPVQDYTSVRLTRVRLQLDRLDAMAAECVDTKALKELADATSRLQEQERQLAGRPLPGTLKPNARQTAQRPAISSTYPVAQPLHDTPNPAQPIDNQGKANG